SHKGWPPTSRPSMRKLLLVFAGLLVVAAAGAAIYWQHSATVMQAAGPHLEPLELQVRPGASVRAVLAELDSRGALADRRAVELQLRLRGWPRVKSGRYEIAPHASPADILRQLKEGRVVLEALTVIEGWTFADMRRAIEAHAGVK